MSYKLLALDIDGTLVNDNREVTPAVRKAIHRAVDAGVTVLLATGRMYKAMTGIHAELGLTTPCMCYGGAQIVTDGEIIYERPVDPLMTYELMNWCHDRGIFYQVYQGSDLCYEKECSFSIDYCDYFEIEGVEIPELRHRKDIRTPKILVIDEIPKVKEYEQLVRATYGDRLQISVSKPIYLELNNPTATKGNALDFLCKRLGITSAECIAVGDATLDLPMIEFSGMGIAMANADDFTKSRSDYICPSNEEDGVAHVIDRFIFGEE